MNRLFVLCAVVVVILLCGCAKKTETVTEPGFSLSQGSDGVTAVNAEIVDVRSSPDQSHIALVLKQSWTDKSGKSQADSWVAIFDPAKKKVVAQTPQPDGFWVGGLFWSPDGKWLAITGSGVSLLGIDGSDRQVVSDIHIRDLVWREDVSGRFLYTGAEDETMIHEYDLDADEDRQIPANHLVLSLFNVNGKPLVGHLNQKKWTYPRNDSLFVSEVDTWKQRLRVPLYDTSGMDEYHIEMSPDGEFFFVWMRMSGGAENVVARTEDAESVFAEPHISVMRQDVIMDRYKISWPKPSETEGNDSYHKDYALLQCDGDAFRLDLRSGGRYYWRTSHAGDGRFVNWWRPAHVSPDGGYRDEQYLAIREDGLWVCGFEWELLKPASMLIKHTPQEE